MARHFADGGGVREGAGSLIKRAFAKKSDDNLTVGMIHTFAVQHASTLKRTQNGARFGLGGRSGFSGCCDLLLGTA